MLFMLCTMFVFSKPIFGTYSDDSNISGAHELIILFDISTSMQGNDPEFLAPDAMKQVVGSLPSYWRIGLVTFNTDVVDAVRPEADNRAKVLTAIDNIRYRRFTNSGAGLYRVVELFSEDALSKTIIYVTDGEMAAMPTRQATAEAIAHAEEMIEQIIESDIIVHTIAVGDNFERFHNEKTMGLAHATGGYLFRDLVSEEISNAASTLVFNVFGAARHQVGAAHLNYSAGRFQLQLPNDGLDFVRVLIESESPKGDIVVNGIADSIEINTGRRFAVIELLNPTDRNISIEFMARGSSSVSIIAEWDLQLMSYISDDGSVRLWFSDNTGNNVLADTFFGGRFIPVLVNGVQTQERIEEGYINLSNETLREGDYIIQTSLSTFGINLIQAAEVRVNIPSEEGFVTEEAVSGEPVGETEEETAAEVPYVTEQRGFNYVPVIIIGIVVLAFGIFILFHWSKKRSSPELKEDAELQSHEDFESNFKFSGKFDVHVAAAENEEEQLSRKFEFGTAQEVSLQKILKECNILNEVSGAEGIYFTSKYGLLQVVNNSNGAIFIGSEKLPENQSRRLTYEENVTLYDNIGDKLVISPGFLYKARNKKAVKSFKPEEHN